MFDLSGKRGLITGGGSGIGKAVAKTFIQAGATVAIADIHFPGEVAESIGALALQCDVSDETGVLDAFNTARAGLGGPLDFVILNAGVGDVGPPLTAQPIELLEKVTRINYWGTVHGLKHAPTVMVDGGAIVSTSSMAAFINIPGSAAYSASKKAITSLTEMSALELGTRGIRVNCICPGYTETSMGSGDEGKQLCEAFTALGRVATVDDMTGVFHFLISDASRYITGQAIKVDGGWSCGPTPALLSIITGSTQAPS
ncbi:SDR family oxidoreductase [bacterium]|nr:SDR family oxidoreductase [bacterium]